MQPTPEDIRDITGPLEVATPLPWWVYVLAIVLIALIAWGIWWLWKNRKPRRAATPKTPREKIELALAEAEARMGEQTPHDFSIRLSDALRLYITEEHQLRATHQTSQEFLATLNQAKLPMETREPLQSFLNRCDALKYARDGGDMEDCQALLQAARRFCEADRAPTPVEPTESTPPPLPTGGGNP